jgi:hypothetical protein
VTRQHIAATQSVLCIANPSNLVFLTRFFGEQEATEKTEKDGFVRLVSPPFSLLPHVQRLVAAEGRANPSSTVVVEIVFFSIFLGHWVVG